MKIILITLFCFLSITVNAQVLGIDRSNISVGAGALSEKVDLCSDTTWIVQSSADWLKVATRLFWKTNDTTAYVSVYYSGTAPDLGWAELLQDNVSGHDSAFVYLYAEANPYHARTATVTAIITKDIIDTITVIQTAQSPYHKAGNTTIYDLSSTVANRRAQAITFTEAGTIQSISIYHNGGTNQVILGVYDDIDGVPGTRLGVTPATTISSSAGWQTISLTSPVSITIGNTVWLAWVFQTNPGVRYISGTFGRAQSAELWSGGMPATFGTATFSNLKYSIYCTYTVPDPDILLDYTYGSSGTFDITSTTPWIISHSPQFDVTPISGSGNTTITVTANNANTGVYSISSNLIVYETPGGYSTIAVTQAGTRAKNRVITSPANKLYIDKNGKMIVW